MFRIKLAVRVEFDRVFTVVKTELGIIIIVIINARKGHKCIDEADEEDI